MDTTATMRGGSWLVALALVALAGCGSSVVPGEDPNMRGDIDAGAGGSIGATGAGGAPVTGSGGARVGGAGGVVAGTGGATAGMGGMTGMGGVTGAGGAADPQYLPCTPGYSWNPTAGRTCAVQTSPGVFPERFKDGHRCVTCNTPTRPAGVPDCTFGGGEDLCVLSCNECASQ